MNGINLYITAHRSIYIDRYKALREQLAKEFPEVVLRVLFSEEEPDSRQEIPDEFEFILPRGFADRLNQSIDESATRECLLSFADRIPADLFRSDIRGVIRTRTPDMLAYEQAVLSEAVAARFASHLPHIVFTSSGTSLLHSVANHLGRSEGAKTYRVHNYLNLNLNLSGQRVWVCSNNRMQLSDRDEDHFDYDDDDVSHHVSEILKAIASRQYKLDQLSKQFRKRRMPLTPLQMGRDIARAVYLKLPFQIGGRIRRLDANASVDRLRVFANGLRNRRLTLAPDRLTRPYLLFALNTPYDSQILVRAPEYRDLLSLVELVAGMTPYGFDLVVREHPAFLGMLDHDRLVGLQRRFPHVRLVSSDAPIQQIIHRANAVLIINNTVLVDAILAGKPVISFGDGYFKGTGLTREVGRLQELRVAFSELVTGALDADMRPQLQHVLTNLFRETFPGPGIQYADKVEMINDAILERLRRFKALSGSLCAWRDRHIRDNDVAP